MESRRGTQSRLATLKLEQVGFEYDSGPLWQPIDVVLEAGRRIGLTGPNGSGKSTLLRLLAGWTPWQSGRLRLGEDGPDLAHIPPEKRALALLTSRPQLYSHWDVAANVAFPAGCSGRPDRSAELLRALDLTELSGRSPQRLSLGQQQRVAWARLLNRDCAWLLADEALHHLDGTQRRQLWQTLEQEPAGLVLVTHQLEQDLPWLDQLYCLEGGRLRALDLAHLWLDPGSLWLAQQLDPEQVWPGALLERADPWCWVPERAWSRAEPGQGWETLWLERREGRDGPRWRVELRGRRFWVGGATRGDRLQLDLERIRPLSAFLQGSGLP